MALVPVAAARLPSNGLSPPAPMGPCDKLLAPPPTPPVPPPRGERGRRHSKQLRRRAKFGWNPHPLQTQSPTCGRRSPTAAPPALLPRGGCPELAPRRGGAMSRASSRRASPRPRSPARPPPECCSTRSNKSLRPCRKLNSASFPPPLPTPRRCGMTAAATRSPPPPPWCAASRRCAAPRATSALAAWRWRRARRCQDCSPRAVATRGSAERPMAA